MPRPRGLALILVVGVLTVMLVLGVAFSQMLTVEFQAATAVRDQEEAKGAADAGLHQAMAFLQYDVWGVNEEQAFACSASNGNLTDRNRAPLDANAVLPQMDGTTAFFYAGRDGYRRIARPISKQRRSLSRITIKPGSESAQDHPVEPQANGQVRVVENDLAWVVNYSDAYKRAGAPAEAGALPAAEGLSASERFPVYSGAPLHDEFLPGPLDNHDLWELRTHVNRVFNDAARDPTDALQTGGEWIDSGWNGHFLAWPAMRRVEEFDYLDTRVCGDSFYRVFRYDLVGAANAGGDAFLSFESGVDPQGVTRGGKALALPQSPRRYLHGHAAAAEVHPSSEQQRLRFTHLGRVGTGGYTDTRGSALNINQVNNNAALERYLDKNGKRCFYNEAKWIYIYPPTGRLQTSVSRYAVTVLPESGLPSANFIGPPPRNTAELTLEEAARSWGLPWYLQALDRGFSARGTPLEQDLLAELRGRNAPADWPAKAAEKLQQYTHGSGGSGPLASRTELALALRKAVFADATVSDTRLRAAAAAYLASQLSVHAYEPLLDAHWRTDRLIIDRGKAPGAASSFFADQAPNNPASIATRRRAGEILHNLRFYYGPDDAREKNDGFTPYHPPALEDTALQQQAAWSKAFSLAWVLSANLDPPHLGQWTSPDFPAWWRGESGPLPLQLVDRKPDYAVGVKPLTYEVKPRVKPDDIKYLDEQSYVGAHGWSVRVNEVGRVLPRKQTDLPTKTDVLALPVLAHSEEWPFDGATEYWFVEHCANFSALDFPVRQRLMDDFAGNWRRHWRLFVMNPDGGNYETCDVLKLPGTRVLTVDLAADPNVPENTGGDALSGDFRDERCSLNRLRIFHPQFLYGGENADDGRRMIRPAVASFNRYTWLWDPAQPKPLTLHDCAGTNLNADSSRRVAAWRDSMAHAHPANYMLVLFKPAELPAGTTGQRIRWCCQRLNTVNDTVVLQAVDLPGEGRPFDEGWEAVDPRNCRDGRIGWKRARAFGPADANPCVPCVGGLPHAKLNTMTGLFASFSGSPAFRLLTKGAGCFYNYCDGANEHALGHYAAGGEMNWQAATQAYCRHDSEDHCGLRSWPLAAQNQNAATLDFYGSSPGMLQFAGDLAKVPVGWFSLNVPAQLDAPESSNLLPDPDLRTWGDLQRVTPLEQSMTAGFLGGFAWGHEIRDDMFWLFPTQDGIDNDLDGLADKLTDKPRHEYDAPGRYQSDRRAVGRINLNEINSVAALWYAGCASRLQQGGAVPNPDINLATVLGRKPDKGYICSGDITTRLNRSAKSDTPFNMLIWPENLYADLALSHAHAEAQYDNLANLRFSLARTLTVSHSAVFTVLVTAQTLDRLGEVHSEVRIRATVERTPEGRMNILEYGPQVEP